MSRGPNGDGPDALLGRVLGGKLRIDALLGSGAMGHVYRARHERLDKDVAIKVLRHIEGEFDVHARRFAREARAASRLEHQNSVAILDFGEDGPDRLLYLVMELVEGEDVQATLNRTGRVELRRACQIMDDALSAVASAHDEGIIHRDLKPSNLIITQRPNDDGALRDFVKVCDFGLAKFVSGARESLDGSAASAAKVAGTPAYMSPEQAVGDALDVRTDLYSCGVILFEMLTGRLPFDGDTAMGVMLKHVSEPPPAPSQFAPHLPQAADDIVLWAMRKERELRCQTARDLRKALRQLRRQLSGELVTISLTAGTRSSADLQPVEPLPESALLLVPDAMDPNATLAPTSGVSNPIDLVSDLGFDAPMATGPIGVLETPIEAPPPEPRAPEPSSVSMESDFDIEALVNEAVESVREEVAVPAPAPAHSLFAGFEQRKAGAEVSERALYIWENYGINFEPHRDAHAFWVRDHRGEELGPLTVTDATTIIRLEAEAGHGRSIEIGDASQHWMQAAAYVKLAGQEDLLDSEMHTPPDDERNIHVGSLDRTSLPALFTNACTQKATGRLVFRLNVRHEKVAFEIHLVGGCPTFVYANVAALQLPQLLVGQRLVQDRLIPGLLQTVIAEERPLEEVVARMASMDLGPYRAVFMRERLRFLFRHASGTFMLDNELLPARTEPFASSLLALVPELVYSSMPDDELHAAVTPYLQTRLARSERFQSLARLLRLSKSQIELAQQILRYPTIVEAIPPGAANRRLYYAMAYILVECGLLLPPL